MSPDKFAETDGYQWGEFFNIEGAKIRYGSLQPEGESKGAMVIVGGFRETIEKYFEVAREMAEKGFTVWLMDWRGQGGSERYLQDNPQKMHGEGYDEHIETLHQFVDQVVKKSAGPLILTAHSMGAHIGLRYLKEHAGVFDSAVLTAPMLDICTGSIPNKAMRQIILFAKAGNFNMEKYRPGGGDWSEADAVFKNNLHTSDPERYRASTDIFKNNPELRMGAPTYGWAYHTFQSIDILNDEEYLKSVATPVLMEISGDDDIVDVPASERASGLLPDCRRVDMPKAKHEIWMERDELRNQWLKKVDAFLEERLNKQAPAPKKPEQNNKPRPPKPG